jgi:hypothetical protein
LDAAQVELGRVEPTRFRSIISAVLTLFRGA